MTQEPIQTQEPQEPIQAQEPQEPIQTQELVQVDNSKLLAEYAKSQSDNEEATIPWISIKGKKFSIGDNKLGTSINVVILASCYDNAFYDKPYDPDLIQPPACFSISLVNDNMIPHESSPSKQHDSCNGCHNNEYESAPNGKGKACKNARRLLIASIEDGKPLLDDLAIVRLPPTSLKSMSSYVKAITSKSKRPLWSIITTLKLDEDSDWPKIVPAFNDIIDDNVILEDIMSSLDYYDSVVQIPYNVESYVAPDDEQLMAASKRKSKMS